jgi:hypothetical protein
MRAGVEQGAIDPPYLFQWHTVLPGARGVDFPPLLDLFDDPGRFGQDEHDSANQVLLPRWATTPHIVAVQEGRTERE